MDNPTRPIAVRPGLFRAIQAKRSGVRGPFQATASMAQYVQTDMNEFPYPRFFRGGGSGSDRPLVFDREAGSRRMNTPGFQVITDSFARADYCFQAPCSTIFPCNPSSPYAFRMPDRCVWVSP